MQAGAKDERVETWILPRDTWPNKSHSRQLIAAIFCQDAKCGVGEKSLRGPWFLADFSNNRFLRHTEREVWECFYKPRTFSSIPPTPAQRKRQPNTSSHRQTSKLHLTSHRHPGSTARLWEELQATGPPQIICISHNSLVWAVSLPFLNVSEPMSPSEPTDF